VSDFPTLLWFRQDLRLRDNPALAASLDRGGPVVPVYVLEEGEGIDWPPGAASRWWLHHSLASLDAALRERGLRLVLARGDARSIIPDLLKQVGAGAVFWNRRYEPTARERDAELKRSLTDAGVEVRSFNASLLFEPHAVEKRTGGSFQVFTPFWRHCLTLPVAPVVRVPSGDWSAPKSWPRSLKLDDLGLLPKIAWADGMAATWQPGEAGARARLRHFLQRTASDYAEERDRPDHEGTSMLSPSLHFGEIGPRQVWAAVAAQGRESGVFPPNRGAQVFLQEIGWREFAYHLLYHFPRTPREPLRRDFARFPWAKDPGGRLRRAWERGQTGYPIVDAGMRQLWHTGWMHNRVRMIVASFLVKHLRLPWTIGADWFWDTLVDADLASNTLGWQWSAGCGADAAPYFRIFAPVLQGRKFDPDGAYVRHWVQELSAVPKKFIHAPWEAPAEILAIAGVALGRDYPKPIVDHATARREALKAWQSLRGK